MNEAQLSFRYVKKENHRFSKRNKIEVNLEKIGAYSRMFGSRSHQPWP